MTDEEKREKLRAYNREYYWQRKMRGDYHVSKEANRIRARRHRRLKVLMDEDERKRERDIRAKLRTTWHSSPKT